MDKFLNDIEREKPIRFTAQQLRIATDNFTHFLGSGGFGDVYKGIFSNGTVVAVKVLHANSYKSIEEQFMAEVSTIGRIHHFNLLRLYGFSFERNMIALVYEYMKNGSLDKYLFRQNKDLGFNKLHDIAIGTAKGIAYLHEECQQRIIHNDIKPENILLDANFHPKVADFGLAKLCNRENTHITMTGRRGTPGYAAPELWMPYPITFKCDVYSFGMLLFETIGRRRNLEKNLPGSQEWLPRWVWKKFEKGELEETMIALGIEESDREKAERMMKVALWCVQDKPEARPLMSVAVKMLEGATEIPTPLYPFRHILAASPGPEQSAPACPPWNGSTFDFSSSMAAESSLMTSATPTMKKYEIGLAST
ncbi:rust resistance kinase Lr10-like [Mangifera indica]|uniref:rust resistance kinase Lr10-like n=1 Tax=Mangifera indica TaxID=29780 RepID=UPI001CFC0890|nr:rust resistance kinase Lr10-like [Mangifera indica]